MRNSHKNGLLKSLTAMFIVVLAVALTLTGCSDKTARELANQALTAAQNAQNAADKAQTSANAAQDKADGAQDSADANKNTIDSLPDSEAVAKVVQDVLNKYVKGADLAEDSIITMGELETFLASDEVSNLLAQYATIEALADYAKAADLTALTQQFTAAQQQITAAMGNYVEKTAYQTQVKAIEDLTKALNDAIDVMATDTELEKALTAAAAKYYSKEEIDIKFANIDFDALKAELNANAKEFVLDSEVQYEAATVEAIKAINEINEKLAAYATIKNTFDEAEYDKMVAKYEETKLLLLRAQRVDSLKDENGDVIVKGVKDIVAEAEKFVDEEVDNLGRELYNAIAAVKEPLLVPVAHITNDEYVSLDQINACWAIINQAKDQIGEGTDAYELVMTVNGEYLPDAVDVLQAAYDNLVAAKDDANGEGADKLINSILAIPAYADLTVDMTDARIAFKSAVLKVSQITYAEWIEHYFANDGENVNIERILGGAISEADGAPSVYNYYIDALAKVAALEKLDEEAAALNQEIFDTLTGKGWYINSYILYSDYETIDALNTKVAEWIKTNNVKTATVVLPNYDDLTAADGAYAYAKRMNDAYVKANEADGLIAKLDEALALDLVLKSEEKINAAYNALNAWVAEFTVDAANKTAIITDAKINGIAAAYERMIVLNNAKANVGAINEKIAALVKVDGENKTFNGNINSMPAIREIRNLIVTWLNTYNVVPAAATEGALANWIANANAEAGDVVLAVTGDYLADNYNMIKHADLDFAIAEYNKIVADAIADAKANVIPKIDAINADDPKMLYQFKNIMNALNAYYAWVVKYNVIDPDITHLDFGEGDAGQEAEDILVPNYLALMNAYAKYLDVAKAASDQYLADKAAYDALAALTTITVKDGAVVKAAFNKATAWKNTYLGETGTWNDVILAIIEDVKSEDILAEATYTAAVEANTAYETLVTTAVTEGEAIKTELAGIAVNVYNGDKIAKIATDYAAWATKYGIVDADYAGTALDTRLAFMKADVIDAQATKQAAYNTLVADAKADFATIKASIEALNTANFNLYAAEIVDPLRVAYDAWAVKYTLTDNTTAAYTAEIDDADILAYKATLEKLIAAEAAVKAIEDDKKAESVTVSGIIAALPEADKVTTANRDAIEAARAAYEKWLNGDGNALRAIDPAKDNAAYGYVVDATKLIAAENALTLLDQMLSEAFAAIDAADKAVDKVIAADPSDANYEQLVAEAEKAIEDAYDSIEEFYEANGGANNEGIDADTMNYLKALAAAKMKLAAEKILNDPAVVAHAKYVEIKKDVNAALTSGLNQLASTTLEEYNAYFTSEDKVAIDRFALIADNVANGMSHVVENYTNA